MIPIGVMLVWMESFECPRYSRLAEVESGGNSASGMAMGGQGEDIFFLSRASGAH